MLKEDFSSGREGTESVLVLRISERSDCLCTGTPDRILELKLHYYDSASNRHDNHTCLLKLA